jgi:hypothetical protein
VYVTHDKVLGELALQVRIALVLRSRLPCWGFLGSRCWGGWLASNPSRAKNGGGIERLGGGWLRGRWRRRCGYGGRWRLYGGCGKCPLCGCASAILRLHLDHHWPLRRRGWQCNLGTGILNALRGRPLRICHWRASDVGNDRRSELASGLLLASSPAALGLRFPHHRQRLARAEPGSALKDLVPV